MIRMMLKPLGESAHPLALGDTSPVWSILGILTLVCLDQSPPVGLLLWVTHQGCLQPIPSM